MYNFKNPTNVSINIIGLWYEIRRFIIVNIPPVIILNE